VVEGSVSRVLAMEVRINILIRALQPAIDLINMQNRYIETLLYRAKENAIDGLMTIMEEVDE